MKYFLSLCPKLHATGLEPRTFKFVTYLPNDLMPWSTTLPTTYGFSSFYFSTQRIERRLFSAIFMYMIDIFQKGFS